MLNKIYELLSKIFNVNKAYLKKFFAKVWEIINKPEMMVLPGQLSFFVILSIIPIFSIIAWIAGIIGITVKDVAVILEKIFTTISFDWIKPGVIDKNFSFSFVVMMIIMFFMASNGANSVIVSCNQIYGIKQKNFFKRRLKATIMVLLLCILYMFILLFPLLGNKILLGFNYFGIKKILFPVFTIVRGPVTWVIIYLFLKTIYVMAPDKFIDRKGINLGAIFTTVFWLIATYLYSYWINNFNSYSLYYGSLSNFAILMLWIYWLCYIFVIGLSLNVKVENNELEKIGVINKKKK